MVAISQILQAKNKNLSIFAEGKQMNKLQKQITNLLLKIRDDNDNGKNDSQSIIIDVSYVKKAYDVLRLGHLDTTENCFKFFSSINLLNAYVKKDYADSVIKNNYVFKKFVLYAVNKLNDFCPNGVDFGMSKIDKVIYLQVYDLQFSFHSCLPKNSEIKLKEMLWHNVKLQPYALQIFNLAMSF